MDEKILFVDDEANILEAYQRALRKEFRVETANGGAQALAMMEERGPYAVVVSDMRMPGMDGVQFLAEARGRAPETVRAMLTGNADQQTAIEAVNEGHIFRFMTKPCTPDLLAKTLKACLRQYHLLTAEKELLEKTLRGSIQVMTDIMSLVNPTAFGRASRVRRLVLQIAEAMRVEESWQTEIAAMLSQVGCITVPEETLRKVYTGESLTAEELKMLRSYPKVGHDLLAHIPRLEPVAEIIACQEKLYGGTGVTDDFKRGTAIPLGARILKVALDFDKLVEGKFTRNEAYREIKSRENWYDPEVVEALGTTLASDESMYRVETLQVKDLLVNMILGENVFDRRGVLLIAEGQEVTLSLRMRLENFHARVGVQEPIKVLIPLGSRETGRLANNG